MTEMKDAIMKGVFANAQYSKAWKKREKTVMFIYVGAILFALVCLFFATGAQVVSPTLRLPEFETGAHDLMVYFVMFTVIFVFSLIAFGVYFVKSRHGIWNQQ